MGRGHDVVVLLLLDVAHGLQNVKLQRQRRRYRDVGSSDKSRQCADLPVVGVPVLIVRPLGCLFRVISVDRVAGSNSEDIFAVPH